MTAGAARGVGLRASMAADRGRRALAAVSEALERGETPAEAIGYSLRAPVENDWGGALWALYATARGRADLDGPLWPAVAEWFAQLTPIEAALAVAEAAGRLP